MEGWSFHLWEDSACLAGLRYDAVLRAAKTEEEWNAARDVSVQLAGGGLYAADKDRIFVVRRSARSASFLHRQHGVGEHEHLTC